MNKLVFCYFDMEKSIVFNAMFLQDRDSFSLWSVNWLMSHDFLRTTVIWFPVALLHSFKSRLFLLLNLLLPKARESSLPCYLTSSRREKKRIHVFYKSIAEKYTQKTKLELKLGMRILLFADNHYTNSVFRIVWVFFSHILSNCFINWQK